MFILPKVKWVLKMSNDPETALVVNFARKRLRNVGIDDKIDEGMHGEMEGQKE